MTAIEIPAGYNTISTIAAVALGAFAGAIWRQWSEALHEEFRVPRLLAVVATAVTDNPIRCDSRNSLAFANMTCQVSAQNQRLSYSQTQTDFSPRLAPTTILTFVEDYHRPSCR
jgi:hypothetical protein